MTMQNQPYIKPERLDNTYYPLTFQPPQQQRTVTHNPQARPQVAPSTYGAALKSTPQTPVATEKNDTNIENLPDFPSIKGVFGWTTVDDVNVPYILRSDKQFVSVRIVEMKLLSRYPNSYPDDLGKHAPLTSFFITENEAKLLNEINIQHCDGDYGKKDFTTKDLIVLLTDFIKFYELVKKTFPDANTAKAQHQRAGWLQIKNTVTPYLSREDGKYVPLSVIQYAAGLLTNEKVNSVNPTRRECDTLNHACKEAGVEFTFSEVNPLIKLKDLLRINPVEIIALPSSNPLKHATYMELPTKNNVTKFENKPQQAQAQKTTTTTTTQQPYRFQPSSHLDILRLQGQSSKNNTTDHNDRIREQQVNIPPHMQGLPMFDPRLAAMYRHPYGMQRFMPPTPQATHGQQAMHGPMVNPLTQYYMTLPGAQSPVGQAPPNQQAPPGVIIPGRDTHSRSPGSSSSTNPSPRSRPPSQSRPPSGSRPPSQPSASPLSPTQLTSRSAGYGTHTEMSVPALSSQLPPPYPGLNLHQLQAMFQQRFPIHFPTTVPPPAHKQNVSPKQVHAPSVVNGISAAPPSLTTTPNITYTNPADIPQYSKPTPQSHTRHTSDSHHTSTPESQKSPGRPPGGSLGAGPPPLILMAPTTQTAAVPKNGLVEPIHVTTTQPQKQQTPISATVTGTSPTVNGNTNNVAAVTPVNAKAVSLTSPKQKSPYLEKIQGAWLNNKSISCLQLSNSEREGRYCLVEAVCKLYFSGCSVNEFLFALEKVLNVPLLTCDDDEEKAFIQYYNLPVDVLKCNKMIKFDDLETFFPQLSYMFPDKNADMLLGQEGGEGLESENNNMNKIDGISPEELAESMPMTLSEMGVKRLGDMYETDLTRKKLRLEDGDEAVIILD